MLEEFTPLSLRPVCDLVDDDVVSGVAVLGERSSVSELASVFSLSLLLGVAHQSSSCGEVAMAELLEPLPLLGSDGAELLLELPAWCAFVVGLGELSSSDLDPLLVVGVVLELPADPEIIGELGPTAGADVHDVGSVGCCGEDDSVPTGVGVCHDSVPSEVVDPIAEAVLLPGIKVKEFDELDEVFIGRSASGDDSVLSASSS